VSEKDNGIFSEDVRVDVVVFPAAVDDRPERVPEFPEFAHKPCRGALFDDLYRVSVLFHDLVDASELFRGGRFGL